MEDFLFFLLEFLTEDHATEVSAVVIQSAFLALGISIWVGAVSLRVAFQRKLKSLLWLAGFCFTYILWNLTFLSVYTRTQLPFLSSSLSPDVVIRVHLMIGVLLPWITKELLLRVFVLPGMIRRLDLILLLSLIVIVLVPAGPSFKVVYYGIGAVIFYAFFRLTIRTWQIYQNSEDLIIRARSLFVFLGLLTCTLMTVLGQLRAENLASYPLPYLGNIFTAAFTFFLFQMISNPRLREVRELILKEIRVLLLTIVLSFIFISLIAWVGENNWELFIFNTFIASFIILSILEPVQRHVDSFFLKNFIVDRYELEKIISLIPPQLRNARSLEQLSKIFIEAQRESDRIYQVALFIWDSSMEQFRLMPPSNLSSKSFLSWHDPLTSYFRENREPLLIDDTKNIPERILPSISGVNAHLIFPLYHRSNLVGLWMIRMSLQSSSPFTSFSNTEINLLSSVARELSASIEQLQHFERQEQQKRLAALGEMSAALAHEVRNPLGAIQGAAQLLETSPHIKDEEDRECIDILTKEIDRMHQTIEQYLNYARTNEEINNVSPSPIVEKVIRSVQKKAQQTETTIHFKPKEQFTQIQTDPLKLQQVLFNLVQNACEAFAKNIWLEMRHKRPHHIVIRVQDDGPGMPPAVLSNIFTPLFTTKRAGSGLGLPICKKIIESLGGQLSVESELHKGTTFRITLPIKKREEDLSTSAKP